MHTPSIPLVVPPIFIPPTPMPSPASPGIGRTLVLVSILLSAFNLRTAVTSLTPLLDQLGQTFGFGAGTAGVFGMLPSAAFALFGVLTPRLAHRIGLEHSALLSMLLAAVGLAMRGAAGSTWQLLASSIIALAGMGIGNVIIPPLIKRYFPQRIGRLSALYLSVLQAGTVLPAILAVPLTSAIGWPLAQASWALIATAAALSWIGVLIRERRPDSQIGKLREEAIRAGDEAPELPVSLPTRRIWRSKLAWNMALMLGMNSLLSYSIFTWLPLFFVEAGGSAELGGIMLAVFSGMGLLTALVIPHLAARMQHPFWLVVACVVTYALAFPGLLLAPMAAPWLWTALLGLGASTFPLGLTLINLRTRTPAGSAALSGFAQGAGYTVACIGPVVFGLLHAATGGWGWPFAFLAVSVALCTVGGWYVCQPRWLEDE